MRRTGPTTHSYSSSGAPAEIRPSGSHSLTRLRSSRHRVLDSCLVSIGQVAQRSTAQRLSPAGWNVKPRISASGPKSAAAEVGRRSSQLLLELIHELENLALLDAWVFNLEKLDRAEIIAALSILRWLET